MKLEKQLLNTISEIKQEANEVYEKVAEFVKKHKKLITTGIILYVIYKFLFSEDSEN